MRTILVPAVDGTLKLSSLVMGTTYFGTTIDKDTAFALLDRYRSLGGNTIDTARSYANWLPGGESAAERLVGEYIWSRGCREEMVVITKGCQHHNKDFSDNRLTPEILTEEFNRSYEVLGIDTIDIYLLHRDHPQADIPRIMETLQGFVEDGRVRALGASNWRIDRILEANDYAAQHGLTPFTISEIQWSLAETTPRAMEDQTIVCMNDSEFKKYQEYGIPLLAYSSQAKGLFSKLAAGGPEALNDKVRNRFYHGENIERAERVLALAKERGVSPAAIALSYIIDNTLEAAAIIGCSNLTQLEDSMTAAQLKLEPDVIEYLKG